MERIWVRLGFVLTEKPMSSYPPANPPMTYSRLAGREVSTWSSEWARQCEVDTLLRMPAAQRLRFLNGSGNPEDGRDGKPLATIRGQAGAEALKADLDRMEQILRQPQN